MRHTFSLSVRCVSTVHNSGWYVLIFRLWLTKTVDRNVMRSWMPIRVVKKRRKIHACGNLMLRITWIHFLLFCKSQNRILAATFFRYQFDDNRAEVIKEADLSPQSAYILFYQKRSAAPALSCGGLSNNSIMSDHWACSLPQFQPKVQVRVWLNWERATTCHSVQLFMLIWFRNSHASPVFSYFFDVTI